MKGAGVVCTEGHRMRIVQQIEDNSVRLEFDTTDAVEGFFDDVKKEGAFFLQLYHELKQYQRLTLIATAPPRFEFEFEAEVIQVISQATAWGTAFQLCWRPGKSEELYTKLRGEAAG